MLGQVVDPPLALPPLISIITSTDDVTPADDRWENGLHYTPESCGYGGTFDPCGDPDVTKGGRDVPDEVDFQPFGVWASDVCSPMGRSNADARARARRQLLANEAFWMEREFWRGDKARARTWPNAYLAKNAGADVISNGAETPTDALALLEAGLAIAANGQRGMIHATPGVVSLWSQKGSLRYEGGRILTINGTIVVPGAGYDGSGPAAAPGGAPVAASDGSVWAYATTSVQTWRGPIQDLGTDDRQAIDRETNTRTVVAERSAAVTFDWPCAWLAAQVNAPVPAIG